MVRAYFLEAELSVVHAGRFSLLRETFGVEGPATMMFAARREGVPWFHHARAFLCRDLITDACPQFEQAVRYVLDVVKTGRKNRVNFVACSWRR